MLSATSLEHISPPSQTSTTAPPFRASDFSHDGKRHLLLAASGSVATIKIPNILEALSTHANLSILLILTNSATNFLAGQSAQQPHLNTFVQRYPNLQGIFLDEAEWAHPWKRGADILHIELRRWADILVIAPLSANTLAKITGGFADNLLTSVVRAWDTRGELVGSGERAGADGIVKAQKKRILVAPAMNTMMWRHRITASQIAILEGEWGVGYGVGADGKEKIEEGWFEVLRPQEKELACGDVGDGALKDWKEIVHIIELRLGLVE